MKSILFADVVKVQKNDWSLNILAIELSHRHSHSKTAAWLTKEKLQGPIQATYLFVESCYRAKSLATGVITLQERHFQILTSKSSLPSCIAFIRQ